MKVSFVIYSLEGGGAERMVSRLSNNFVERGIDTDLILLFDTGHRVYRLDDRVGIYNFSCLECKNKAFRKICQVKRIHSYIEEEKPDVLFCFIITILPFGVLANFFHKNPCRIVTSQRTNPRVISVLHRLLVRPFLHMCDGFVFQTEGVKNVYPKWLKKKSVVIGNIAPSVKGDMTSIKKDPNAICSVGRLHTDKDFKTLITAFSLVCKEKKEASLHIYGEGPQKEELVELINYYGIDNNVVFEGFSKNISEELKKYEIFAFSSKAEGMPNSLIEAMACGLACVATNCDFGPSDIIDDGINGILVPVGNSEKMAENLLILLDDVERRERIQKEAKKISAKYSEETIVKQYVDFINKVCI